MNDGAPKPVRVGLSLMPSDDFRVATASLFDAGEVDAVEWSVDMGFGVPIPPWLDDRLRAFGRADRLYGHGVEMSPFSADRSASMDAWLDDLERAAGALRVAHFSEHFGFMTATGFLGGTPLPVPWSRAALDLGVERFREIRARVGCPVGIENLALALGADDVRNQPRFLSALCDRADLFLLLDVHNLYCQALNFPAAMDGSNALDRARALALAYPLHRVRELHVSGGSLTPIGFRRDSHDDGTPEDVLELVRFVVPRCPNLEVVILERSDRTLFGAHEAEAFREEFAALKRAVFEAPQTFAPPAVEVSGVDRGPLEDDADSLASIERAMLAALSTGAPPAEVRASLRRAPSAGTYEPWIASWEEKAIDVATSLVLEWSIEPPPSNASEASATQLAIVQAEHHRPARRVRVPIRRPGPGQVLVRVHASGVCGTDVHIREGRFALPLPLHLGHEPVGVIEAIGEGVSHLALGDRVGVPWVQAGCGRCRACARGALWMCVDPITWIQNGGGHAELVVAEARGVVQIPDDVPFELAAPMMCAGFTVMSGYRAASPRPGERVAVLGIGGLGHLGVQIARAMGHDVIALTSSTDKARDAAGLGAMEVVVCDDDAGAALEARGGVDVILSTTSSIVAASSAVKGLCPGGRLVLLGLGAGALTLDPMTLILAQASVVGGLPTERAHLVDALDLVSRGTVRPSVERYPMNLAERAMNRVRSGRVRFRAVLEP